MQSRPMRVVPRIVVNGSITVSCPISTSTSMTVAAGSTMPTPASMWRSWIARCASTRTRASVARSLTPSTSASSSTTCAATFAPSALQHVQHLGQVQLTLARSPCSDAAARAASASAVEHEDARVHLANLLLGRRRVARRLCLDHPRHRAVGLAHDPSRSRSGHRGSSSPSSPPRRSRGGPDQRHDRLSADERDIPAQDEHRRRRVPRRLPRRRRAPPFRQRPLRRCRPGAPAPPARRHRAAPPPSARAGESTTTTLPAPAASAARTGHSTIGIPHSSCSTFGLRERMRVPWPAARIRTEGALMGQMLFQRPCSSPADPHAFAPARIGQAICGSHCRRLRSAERSLRSQAPRSRGGDGGRADD